MTNEYLLTAEVRTGTGSADSSRLRNENKIPAVLYGGGKDPAHIALDHDPVMHSLENEAFFSNVLSVKLGKKTEKVVLKGVQRHPSKPRILHMDFQRVSAKEKIIMRVPLHFVGEAVAPGVKAQGGLVSHHISDTEVSCLPADLPEFIEVDVSSMSVGDVLHLADLKCPKGVELVGIGADRENTPVVVSIHMPRAAVEEEAVSEEEAEPAPVETGE